MADLPRYLRPDDEGAESDAGSDTGTPRRVGVVGIVVVICGERVRWARARTGRRAGHSRRGRRGAVGPRNTDWARRRRLRVDDWGRSRRRGALGVDRSGGRDPHSQPGRNAGRHLRLGAVDRERVARRRARGRQVRTGDRRRGPERNDAGWGRPSVLLAPAVAAVLVAYAVAAALARLAVARRDVA